MVTFEHGAFEAIPLELLLPGTAEADTVRLRAAAHALDAVRPPADAARWGWVADHATFPGPHFISVPVVLYTDITYPRGGTDWTAFGLVVSWTDQGLLEVSAEIGVGCYCEVDHGEDRVADVSLSVGGSRSLADAFEQAARQAIDWTAGPTDPNYWRAQAGLPQSDD